MENDPQQPHHPKNHIKVYVWIALVVAALMVAINGYVYFLRLSYLQQGAEAVLRNEQAIEALRAKRLVPSDWKTYTNTEYGFEFKYPGDHTAYSRVDFQGEKLIPARSNDNDVAIAEREAHLFCCEPATVHISVLDQKISPREWFRQNSNKYFSEGTVKSERDIQFQGQSALEVMGENYMSYKLLVISRDGRLFIIKQNFNSEFLNQVLSTFRFLDSGDTSLPVGGWKIYTNTEYGFQLTFTDAWKNFQAVTKNNAIYFAIPTTDSRYGNSYGLPKTAAPMTIWVFTKSDWAKKPDSGDPSSKMGYTYINENSQYVFVYSQWQDAPTDLIDVDLKISQILSTFRFAGNTAGCTSDSCSAGYVCDYSRVGQHDPNYPGGVRWSEEPQGDQTCHKTCTSDSDCSSDQKCISKQLWSIDYGKIVKFCQ